MENFVWTILRMSFHASVVVLLLAGLRLLLKKTSKSILFFAYAAIAVLLICPWRIPLPVLSSSTSGALALQGSPTSQPSAWTEPWTSGSIPPPAAEAPIINTNPNSIDSWQIFVVAFFAVWVVGTVGMLVYAAVSYGRLRRRVREAVRREENMFACEGLMSPFVLGVWRPRIYMPIATAEEDVPYMLAHERAHIRRLDHIWKLFAFGLLCVYWFNPVLWLGFWLFCRDMEQACDERVLRELGEEAKKPYAAALVRAGAVGRLSPCPIAFAEVGVKERVARVLHFKRAARWTAAVSLVLCLSLSGCALLQPTWRTPAMVDGTPVHDAPVGSGPLDKEGRSAVLTLLRHTYPTMFDLDTANGLQVQVWQMAPGGALRCWLRRDGAVTIDGASIGSILPDLSDESYMMSVGGVDVGVMRMILSTYAIAPDKVQVLPSGHPLSSYIADFHNEQERAAYIASARAELGLQGDAALPAPVGGCTLLQEAVPIVPNGDIAQGRYVVRYEVKDGYVYPIVSMYSPSSVVHTVFTMPRSYTCISFGMVGGAYKLVCATAGEQGQTHIYDISLQGDAVVLTRDGVRVPSEPYVP